MAAITLSGEPFPLLLSGPLQARFYVIVVGYSHDAAVILGGRNGAGCMGTVDVLRAFVNLVGIAVENSSRLHRPRIRFRHCQCRLRESRPH